MNEHEIQEQMEQTVVLEPLTEEENAHPSVSEETDMDDTQEFDLEEIMREFGGSMETTAEESVEAVDEAETETAEETVEETAEETTEEAAQMEEKNAVTGDTIGDTRKDVVGVALDIFIKMMSTVANTLGPVIRSLSLFK